MWEIHGVSDVDCHACPLPPDRKSWNTPWTNLVCFLIHTQPDPSLVVSGIEEPSGTVEASKTIFSSG
jgi:hypothetical protein